jgi:hypothetical protein
MVQAGPDVPLAEAPFAHCFWSGPDHLGLGDLGPRGTIGTGWFGGPVEKNGARPEGRAGRPRADLSYHMAHDIHNLPPS